MVQLGLLDNFKRQLLQGTGVTVPTKEPKGLLSQTDLTSCEMSQVEMKTA